MGDRCCLKMASHPSLIFVLAAVGIQFACAVGCGDHGVGGCYGDCAVGGSCGSTPAGECGCNYPKPPASSWKCVNGQCQNVFGGIDKGSCLAACDPSEDLYKCIGNMCVKNGTGVIKSICDAVCQGPPPPPPSKCENPDYSPVCNKEQTCPPGCHLGNALCSVVPKLFECQRDQSQLVTKLE